MSLKININMKKGGRYMEYRTVGITSIFVFLCAFSIAVAAGEPPTDVGWIGTKGYWDNDKADLQITVAELVNLTDAMYDGVNLANGTKYKIMGYVNITNNATQNGGDRIVDINIVFDNCNRIFWVKNYTGNAIFHI